MSVGLVEDGAPENFYSDPEAMFNRALHFERNQMVRRTVPIGSVENQGYGQINVVQYEGPEQINALVPGRGSFRGRGGTPFRGRGFQGRGQGYQHGFQPRGQGFQHRPFFPRGGGRGFQLGPARGRGYPYQVNAFQRDGRPNVHVDNPVWHRREQHGCGYCGRPHLSSQCHSNLRFDQQAQDSFTAQGF